MMSDTKQVKRSSMRAELSIILVAVIVSALFVIGVVTYFGLEPFYKENKIRKLISTYQKIDALTDDYDDFSTELYQIAEQDNIRITVTDSQFESYDSTGHDGGRYVIRLFGYYSGFFNEAIKILVTTDKYTIQQTYDKQVNVRYLEMWGQLSDGDYFLIATPLESMKQTARLSMVFYVLVGLATIFASIIIITLIIRRYTRPIALLTDQAKSMANLNFETRYTGNETNEIGELGESFNKMADELEKAISELKSANVELMRDNERKTKVDEVRKEFLSNVSHELKTPIALIMGYAEGLKDNIAEDPDSMDFYCDVIIDEASKMNMLVRKLLTLNQLEFGNDQTVIDRFDLTQLIRGVIEGMKLMLSDAGVSVVFDLDRPLYVWGDEFKIEEVVTNYMSNAIHHADGENRIEITVEEKDGIVKTTVFNTGNHIPEADIGHVFEKFF
ncbi:MAG: HAMP domain-containing sensor histidine kinase, partial [Lachnospiraceae bacterium]|nr:HAMP domain-containing sensor histidine kinase [Lachnospiraceae bacterium]